MVWNWQLLGQMGIVFSMEEEEEEEEKKKKKERKERKKERKGPDNSR